MGMLSVAVVEDDVVFSALLESYIKRYAAERHMKIDVVRFADGAAFLEGFHRQFQIVFMDVVMPHINGIETAKRMRRQDADVCLVFITSMSQYAIHGYEVAALDYVVKPLDYDLFVIKMDRAVSSVHVDAAFVIQQVGGMQSVRYSTIMYVESQKHYIVLHTTAGDLRMRGTISSIVDSFKAQGFAMIRKSILVNMAYVIAVDATGVTLDGVSERLPVSRTCRADFRKALTVFVARRA